jgi:hypothetical protein
VVLFLCVWTEQDGLWGTQAWSLTKIDEWTTWVLLGLLVIWGTGSPPCLSCSKRGGEGRHCWAYARLVARVAVFMRVPHRGG